MTTNIFDRFDTLIQEHSPSSPSLRVERDDCVEDAIRVSKLNGVLFSSVLIILITLNHKSHKNTNQ